MSQIDDFAQAHHRLTAAVGALVGVPAKGIWRPDSAAPPGREVIEATALSISYRYLGESGIRRCSLSDWTAWVRANRASLSEADSH